MPAPGALVFLLFLLGMMTGDLQAAPIPFQPYGDKSSADVVLQLAEVQKASWQAELETILPVQLSSITQAELSAFESLIERYQDDDQALTLLVPLYWQVAELSGHIGQRQHFLTGSVSISDDFMALVLVELLLQLHEHSLHSLNDYNDLRNDLRLQYEQLLSQLQQQEQHAFLNRWASGLLYFYMPGGGLSVADRWLQSQAETVENPEIIIVYRKILHDLVGQTFPAETPGCWPLACADAMTTDEMAQRAQQAYKRFNNNGFGQAWEYLKAGVHCLYNAQSNPRLFNFSLCLGFFNSLNTMLRMLEDSLAVNGYAAGWREYRLLQENYAETFNFQNRVSNQIRHAYQSEEKRINRIEDPEARLQASQNLLNGPLSSFASSHSIHQARQRNERQLQAIREAKRKQAVIDQAYQRYETSHKHLWQHIQKAPNDENLWQQLLDLADSSDTQTSVAATGRETLKEQARSGLATARENNRLSRLYQQFKQAKAVILQRFRQNPESALEDLIALVNSESGESLTPESRSDLREKYQTQLNGLREERRAIDQANANIKSSFERAERQEKKLLTRIEQFPDSEEPLNEYLTFLNSPDAQTGYSDSYRQKVKVEIFKQLQIVRRNQQNRQLFEQFKNEYAAIMATYEEDPILATENALALLNTEAAESLTPESREEKRKYNQKLLNLLRDQKQTQERLDITKQYLARVSALNQQRDQTGDYKSWAIGFIALLDSDTGRYFSEEERVEKKHEVQKLLEELEAPFETDPTDGDGLFFSTLEAIGRGEDPLTQGIERATEGMLRISYQHFPQGTERVLDVLNHVDSAIDATVEYIDVKTGHQFSAPWRKLDESARARILGVGKVLSVLVPVAKVKALAELARTPSPALKKDGWHPDSVEARHKEWQEHYGGREDHKHQGIRGYVLPPESLKAFPEAYRVKEKTHVQGGGGKRYRWKDKKGYIYEWDYQHGAVEKYDKRGHHLGEFDPISGQQVKPADNKRTVEP